jgi:hypothetical protein
MATIRAPTCPAPGPPESRWSANRGALLTAEDDINASQNEIELATRDFADSLSELLLVERDDERHVCHGILRESSRARGQKNISRCVTPLEVTGERNAHDRTDATDIDRVTLNHQYRSPIPRSRSHWLTEIGPPDFALSDHHSVRLKTRRAASVRKTSGSSTPMSATTWFMRSVSGSGA